MRDDIEQHWRELADVTRSMPFGAVARAAEALLECYRRGGTIFAVGNGGSAATASHFACDLAKNVRAEGLPPFRAVALTDNMPLVTAWANDTSYARVFAEQLAALVRPGDVVVAISCSGESPNVLRAAETARELGAQVVALTGRTGGKLARHSDHTIRVPSDSIEQVEDAHMAIAHSACVVLRARLLAEAAQPVLLERAVGAPAAVSLKR